MIATKRRASRLAMLTGILVITALLLVHMLSGSSKTPTPPAFVPSSFDWSTVPLLYPPSSIKALPTGRPKHLPPVQAPASAFDQTADPRRDAVRKVFKRSWDAYRKHAWLHDELKPVSGGSRRSFGGWAATLVDSLDTLWIMGFDDEFAEASAAVGAIDFGETKDRAVNLFEVTIRHLGGLLSAYDLSGDRILLQKAVELGNMLYKAFDTPNNLPGFWLNFRDAYYGDQRAGTSDPSAVPSSLCLEFTRLSQITGDPKYYAATDKVTRFLESTQHETTLPGMWPVHLDFRHETAGRSNHYTVGAAADSLYEYLPKMHALLGGLDDTYERLYRGAMDVISKNLLFRPMLPNNDDVLFLGDARVRGEKESARVERLSHGQHLTCFAGGMFGLGGKLFGIDKHVNTGERLARGCGWAYGQFPTGLMPEEFTLLPCDSLDGCEWDEDLWRRKNAKNMREGWLEVQDPRYILRPEAIESIFLLYRMTGKEYLRDIAWDMFQNIQRSTETGLAYSAIADVMAVGKTKKQDSMESFWTAETLKYFYLIFSPPSVINLDEYVFNTEAHPFKRPTRDTAE